MNANRSRNGGMGRGNGCGGQQGFSNTAFQQSGLGRGRGLGLCSYRMDDSQRIEELKALRNKMDQEILWLESNLSKKA